MFKSMLGSIVLKTMAKKSNNAIITEDDIRELIREIRISLIDSDVNLTVVKEFIKKIKEEIVDKPAPDGVSVSDYVLNVIKEELVAILGKNQKSIDFNSNKKMIKIMLIGLQGSGKTTTVAKIANYAKNKFNKNPLLVACDIYRPAAIDQLKQLASDIHVDFYQKGTQNPSLTTKEAMEKAQENNNDVIIVDTAGRLQTDEKLMDELVEIKKVLSPDEIILVVDAMSGQDIINVASEFHNKLKLTGIAVTKLDSDAKAGAVLSLIYLLDVPIKFTGVGEKIGSLDLFYPNRIADRILGLGDILTLAEKAADIVDEKKARGQMQRMLSGKMDLEDLMNQLEQVSKMGSIGGIMSMIPGMNQKIDDDKSYQIEQQIKVWRVLMSSMTLKERRNPKILKRDANRRIRIIKGSGRKPDELNKLLKRWEEGNKKMTEIGKMLRSGNNPFKSGDFNF